MKKIFTIICAVLAILALGSCHRVTTADKFGWYSDFGEAKDAAKQSNKSIILYFSALDTDGKSAEWNDKIFKTTEFKKKFSSDFVFCNIDFSDSRFNDAYGAEAKDDQLRQKLSEDMILPSYYAVESLPAVFVLTKQGYVISPLAIEENYDIADVQAEIEKSSERRTQITKLLTTISTGKKDETLKAIDELYDLTEDEYKFLLEDLHEKYIELDKNNESGGTVDHIFALANARAQKAFFENDYEKTIEQLELPLQYEILTPKNRQETYYNVGYFLAMSGSTDYQRMIDYFQKAYDAAPESEYAENIQQMIINLNEMKAMQGYAPETENAQQDAAGKAKN